MRYTKSIESHHFHLPLQDLPEGNWYCPNCTCRICGCLVDDKKAASSNDALKCLQCEHKCNTHISSLLVMVFVMCLDLKILYIHRILDWFSDSNVKPKPPFLENR